MLLKIRKYLPKIKKYILDNRVDVITSAVAVVVVMLASIMLFGGNSSDENKEYLSKDAFGQVVSGEIENETSKDAEQVAGTQIGIEATTEEQTTSLTYEDLNLVMYASESLNVRDLPNEEGEIIGNLIEGKRVKITGRCNQTDWYRISYGDGEGFVCYEYLVEECPVPAPDIVAEAAILYDMDTCEVLYEKNADARMYPASVTKIMTTMLACESGRLDEMITFSQRCKEVPYDSSIYGVRVGESVTLRDSLYMLMLVSGNDVGVGIAEHLSANEAEFAALMTKRAKELGAKNTNFANSHGYHDENHYTTARDMMFITLKALTNEEFVKVWQAAEYTVPKTNKVSYARKIVHTHRMLRKDLSAYYPYALGGKTGFHDAAGRCCITTAKKDGRTLLCVTMKSNKTNQYKDGEKLFEYCFTYK